MVLGAGRGRAFACVAAGIVGAVVLGGCSGGDGGGGGGGTKAAPAASAEVTPAAQIAVSPKNGAAGTRPDQPIAVQVTGGRLTRVTVTGEDGEKVLGALSADGLRWTSSGKLVPDTTYTVTAAAENEDGKSNTASSAFTTLKPKKTVYTTVTPSQGWTVGVGMPVIVDFSRPVEDRAAALKALSVASTPKVEGGWRWFSSQQV